MRPREDRRDCKVLRMTISELKLTAVVVSQRWNTHIPQHVELSCLAYVSYFSVEMHVRHMFASCAVVHRRCSSTLG